MKLSELKKQIEDTITELLNEAGEDNQTPDQKIQAADKELKQTQADATAATQSANNDKSSKAKQMTAASAKAKMEAAKAAKSAAEEEKKEKGSQPSPKKPGI